MEKIKNRSPLGVIAEMYNSTVDSGSVDSLKEKLLKEIRETNKAKCDLGNCRKCLLCSMNHTHPAICEDEKVLVKELQFDTYSTTKLPNTNVCETLSIKSNTESQILEFELKPIPSFSTASLKDRFSITFDPKKECNKDFIRVFCKHFGLELSQTPTKRLTEIRGEGLKGVTHGYTKLVYIEWEYTD